jgi:hypothetical protein
MKSLRRLLGRKAPEANSSEIPHEVQTAIAGSSVLDRSTDDNPRVLIATHGYGAFIYSRDAGRQWLESTFKQLTEAQTARALQMLASHVAGYQQMANLANMANMARAALAEGRPRSTWRDWKRLEKL